MTRFLGVEMLQSWSEFPVWEEFFSNNHLKTFIELGTGAGGMALYFSLQCRQRGITFHTFDHQHWLNFDDELQKLLNLENCYHHCDIFSDAGKKEIVNLIQTSRKPLAIFFDNGNKPLEWSTFAPLTTPNDFCIVHDWTTEFFPKDIGDVLVDPLQIAIDNEHSLKVKTMWFKRQVG